MAEDELAGRSPEDAARLSQTIDGIPVWNLMQVMTQTVGVRRVGVLFGWAVLWQLKGEPNGRELRLKMEGQGLTEATAYRALADFRRIGDALLQLEGYDGAGVFSTLRSLAGYFAL